MKYKHCQILKALSGYNVHTPTDIINVDSIKAAKTLIDSLKN